MQMLLLFGLLLLNFGISWFNAYSVGRSWADSKAIGGWPRFITWCAAIMSAAGFTWCYLIVLAMIAGATGLLAPQYVQAALEVSYVIIILPVLGSGFGIWIDSFTTAWRRRDAVSIGIAGWNTFAQVHNTYEAVSALPDIFKHLGDIFEGGGNDDAKGKALLLVLLLVLLALCGGVFTTVAIVRTTARKYAHGVLGKMGSARGRLARERA
ncbi:MAG: hypothetical protein HYT12_01500 [Candidatus Liptonbacteria bacterium]|nr:hypothetical protein [Candidatus Liptonbacteria bacterium]